MKQNNTTIKYYKTYSDEFVSNKNQDYQLSDTYSWIHRNKIYRICSLVVYIIAWIFGWFYCRMGLHCKIKNRKVLREYKKNGIFLYGNHTQPVGDVFLPTQVCGTKRIYTVVSPANLGLPVIGPLLPMLGALPVPSSLNQLKELWNTIIERIREQHCVVIYPEAHVWPYCTRVRPFPVTSFRFPVECHAPSFCMTTTYQKRKFGKRPKITIYVDGPFWPEESLKKRERQKKLCKEIQKCMVERSKNSTYQYIEYKEETP